MKRHGALAVDVPLLCDFLHVRDLSGNSPNKILEQVLATLDHEEQGMNPSHLYKCTGAAYLYNTLHATQTPRAFQKTS